MIKKIEVFYKEDECFIKDNFDENLKVTKAEKIMIDNIIKEKFIEKWNGELPKVSGSSAILDINSLLK